MIWIFNKEDRLVLFCSNENPEALPILSATMQEVLNGDLLLDFEVPLDHSKAALIEEGFTAAVQRENGAYELFIITEKDEIKGSDSTLHINCRHAITELQDEIIEAYTATAKAAAIVLPDLLAGTRWTAGTIENTAAHDLTIENETVLSALKTFIDRWQGEISYSFDLSSLGIVNRRINFAAKIGQEAGRRFEWRRDLLEVQRTINADHIKTALIGIGKTPATDTAAEAPLYFTNTVWRKSLIYGVDFGATFTGSFILNKNYAGADNLGEIQISTATGNTLTGSAGQTITVTGSTEIGTHLEGTNADTYGKFYVMYIGSDFSRFASTKPYANYTEQFIYCFYDTAAAQWRYHHNTTTSYAFTPNANDFIIAEIERTSGSTGGITSLEWIKKNPTDKPAGQRYIEDTEGREKYGRINTDGSRRNRWGFYINNEITDPAQLLEETWEALQSMNAPHVSYRAKVLDLAKIEGKLYKEVNLGDTVTVIDDDLNIETKARCLEIKHDLLQPEDTEILLDNFQEIFTAAGDTVKRIEETESKIGEVERQIGEKINRGETILTDWLEEDIALLRERILAGGGTVTINDNDGILIEDDPAGKTGGALRLLGGTLALADSFNAATGEYNWQTFGTGEGILADLITARKISFDHAQGGTLVLGGVNNVNGTLKVHGNELDSAGLPIETIQLDGNKGGFEKLYVGELTAGNAPTIYTGANLLNYYVDYVAGNNANDGLSTATPLANIQAAIDKIPAILNKWIYIRVIGTDRTFTENLYIEDITGSGRIGIELGRRNTLRGQILVKGCRVEVNIATLQGATVSTAATHADRATILAQENNNGSAAIYGFFTEYVNVYDLIINGNKIASYGINCYKSTGRTMYVEIYNCNTGAVVFQVASHGEIYHSAGSNPRGITAAQSSIVGGAGKSFAATIAGSEIVKTDGAYVGGTWTYDAGSAKPTYAASTTSTWTANDTHSYNANTGWASDYIYQGKRPTDIPIWYGVIFYNTANFGVLKNADGTNRPITKVRLRLQRTNNTGDNTSRQPYTYTNMQTSASGSIQTLSNGNLNSTGFLWGENKWITLPNSYGTAFQAGTAKSIVLYYGSNETHYMRFESTVTTLEITHG